MAAFAVPVAMAIGPGDRLGIHAPVERNLELAREVPRFQCRDLVEINSFTISSRESRSMANRGNKQKPKGFIRSPEPVIEKRAAGNSKSSPKKSGKSR